MRRGARMGPPATVIQFRTANQRDATMPKVFSFQLANALMLSRFRALTGALVVALFCTPAADAQEAAQQARSGEYELRAGDSITVSVWKEVDLQRRLIIRPDGRFSFPLAGEVQAAGRTADQVRVEIENKLKGFIPEAVVTVIVEDVSGNRVYVIGQVAKPGVYIMNPSLNVLQALSLAGGGTPFAKLDEISVVRGTGPSQKSLPFNYNRVVSGKQLQENITLQSGDVVVVP
jgi:polysaccharide biosynthesis/export protein